MLGTLQGSGSGVAPKTSLEAALHGVTLAVSLVCVCLYTALCTHFVMTYRSSQLPELKRTAHQYCARHHLHGPTRQMILRTLCSSQGVGPGQTILSERKMLEMLPTAFQEDVQYEANMPKVFNVDIL